MIETEQFRCLIPSPNAVKEGVIYCSANSQNMGDILSSISGIVSALVAAGLAFWTIKSELKRSKKESDRLRNTRLREEGELVIDAVEKFVASAPKDMTNTVHEFDKRVARFQAVLGSMGSDYAALGTILSHVSTAITQDIYGLLMPYEDEDDMGVPSYGTLRVGRRLLIWELEPLIRDVIIEVGADVEASALRKVISEFDLKAKRWIEKVEKLR